MSEPLKVAMSRTLEALIAGGELPLDRNGVGNSIAHLVHSILDLWSKEPGNPIAMNLDAVFAALHDRDDEIVQSIGAMERQAMWGILGMLRSTRDSRAER